MEALNMRLQVRVIEEFVKVLLVPVVGRAELLEPLLGIRNRGHHVVETDGIGSLGCFCLWGRALKGTGVDVDGGRRRTPRYIPDMSGRVASW